MKNQKFWHKHFLILVICFTLLGVFSFRYNVPKSEEFVTKYLSEKGKKLIENQLLSPLRAKMKIESSTKIMSRCPSGLRQRIATNPSESKPYFMGHLNNYIGCRGQKVCDFRVNVSEEIIEVLDTQSATYVEASTWVNNQNAETLAQTQQKKSNNNSIKH